ncbi:MAG: MFS transporter [Candidatus Sumerlaea sp.]|nr:MFS transporter [Candidatus Sumerlaea chitinivorans]GIX45398.1 MAG: MFS transporter [Candidatus Sumerlaea sp.]
MIRKLADILALRRNVVVLLAMLVLVMMGERMFERYLPKYLEELGASAPQIGILGFLQNGLGAIYALFGGFVTDRFGHKRSLFLFALLNLLGYALLLVPHWGVVLAATFFYMGWSQLSLPATFSLVAEQLPQHKRVMGLAVQAVVRRIPMAVGPVVGGAILTYYGTVQGMPYVVGLAALLTLVAVWMNLRLSTADRSAAQYERLDLRGLWKTFRPELKRLLISDILIRFCEQIPYTFVSLWVLDVVARSNFELGLLTAVEMTTAASLYIPVALWVDAKVRKAAVSDRESTVLQTERKPFVLATFVFFTAFPALLYFSRSLWWLVLAFVVRGLKEFGEPSRKALIADLAAPGVKARTVGLYYFIRDLTVSLAALMGGALWGVSPGLNLWVAFAFGVAGTLFYALTTPDSAEK